MGYYKAGFTEIVGVDIENQPNYPFEFVLGDCSNIEFGAFDLVHASPPCQRWSYASGKRHRYNIFPDLLRPIRRRLQESEQAYVIENVEGSPLKDPIKLCGTLFPNLRVLRHRLFECSFNVPQPKLNCQNHPRIASSWEESQQEGAFVTVAGGGQAPLEVSKRAMNIDWMNQKELTQSIPPDYTEYIGKFAKLNI